jgi:hypothetical protein
MTRAGFAKVDITPRVGVPLCGFGPFLNRVSIGIRERLWARAMAVEHDSRRVVVVSCDLVSVDLDDVTRVRELVRKAIGLDPSAVLVACTHTHSGPDASARRIGWGGYDPPYMALLPERIARAAIAAFGNLEPATIRHAEIPCEGIGLNREHDRDAPPLDEVLRDDWRPEHPELTDTTCHVVRVDSEDGRLLGLFSNFGCHPVCCCQLTRFIHGDFVGVAGSLLEREHPGAVALFLQGANGDVNSCVVHKPEQEALLALDVIAGRYARSLRDGLRRAEPVEIDAIGAVTRGAPFATTPWSLDELRAMRDRELAVLRAPDASDADHAVRLATVRLLGLRRMLDAPDKVLAGTRPIHLQGVRIGPISLLASPFETFRAIKEEIVAGAQSAIPLVVSIANDTQGYAADRETLAGEGRWDNYAAGLVPIIHGHAPYARPHDDLVAGLLAVEEELLR